MGRNISRSYVRADIAKTIWSTRHGGLVVLMWPLMLLVHITPLPPLLLISWPPITAATIWNEGGDWVAGLLPSLLLYSSLLPSFFSPSIVHRVAKDVMCFISNQMKISHDFQKHNIHKSHRSNHACNISSDTT
ncbi:hypothetical protein LXL04_003312 [Taraxacum kok-saghyz]